METFRKQTTWLEGNEGEGKPRRLESGAEFAFDAEPGRSEKAWGTKEETAKLGGGVFLLTPSTREPQRRGLQLLKCSATFEYHKANPTTQIVEAAETARCVGIAGQRSGGLRPCLGG